MKKLDIASIQVVSFEVQSADIVELAMISIKTCPTPQQSCTDNDTQCGCCA